MNDFAKSQLMKYGWTEGKGLGKHGSGITEALKPKLKFDTAGIGHTDKDWDNWWENAFNKAANNITINLQDNGGSVSFPKKDEPHDSPKKDLDDKLSKKSGKYGNFLKTSTLLNGNLVEENNINLTKQESIAQEITHIQLTDEELFKVCGGRTAHKGARHGLTLNGKLKRIAQQEQEFLGKNTHVDVFTKARNISINMEDEEGELINNNENTVVLTVPSNEQRSTVRESKTVRRKNKRRINDLTYQLNTLCNISDSDERSGLEIGRKKLEQKKEEKHKRKKGKKEKKRGQISHDMESVEKEEVDNKSNESLFPVSKESEQLTEQNISAQIEANSNKEFDSISIYTRKKKKKKKHNDQYKIITDKCEDEEFHGSQVKRLKRSHKSDSALPLLVKNKEIGTVDYQFQTVFSCNEEEQVSQENKKVAETYLKKRTKKKQAKLLKMQQAKLSKITDTLMAIHIKSEEPIDEVDTRKALETKAKKLIVPAATMKKSLKSKKKRKNKS